VMEHARAVHACTVGISVYMCTHINVYTCMDSVSAISLVADHSCGRI